MLQYLKFSNFFSFHVALRDRLTTQERLLSMAEMKMITLGAANTNEFTVEHIAAFITCVQSACACLPNHCIGPPHVPT
jgi:hypothetical protein